MIFLIIILILVIAILVVLLKIKKTFRSMFGTSDIKRVIKDLDLENESTPKTLMGMESVYLPQIKRDFPDLNVNELKAISEEKITNCLTSVSNKIEESENEKIKYWIKEKIDKNLTYSSIKIHKTIIKKYQKDDKVATITFQTALEYVINNKKVQTRFETEFIHVLDLEKIKENDKIISINCPNCGAPVKNLKIPFCEYCNCGIMDVVKRIWNFNNIKEF